MRRLDHVRCVAIATADCGVAKRMPRPAPRPPHIESHADLALHDIEQERVLLEQLKQQLLRTVSQLQIEESDLVAQLATTFASTATADLRTELYAELFESAAAPQPEAPEARQILGSLLAQASSPPTRQRPSDDDDNDDDDDGGDDDEDQRWAAAQARLRLFEAEEQR